MEELKRCFRLGVVVVDAEGVVRCANAAAEVALDGPGAGALVGETLEVCSAPEDSCVLCLRRRGRDETVLATCAGRVYWDGEPAYFALLGEGADLVARAGEERGRLPGGEPAVESRLEPSLDAYAALHALE